MTEQNLQINKTDMIVEEVLKRLIEKMHTQEQKTTQQTQQTQPEQTHESADPIFTTEDFHRCIFVTFENGEEHRFKSLKPLYREITQRNEKPVFRIYKTDASMYIKIIKSVFNIYCEEYHHPKISKLRMILKNEIELTV